MLTKTICIQCRNAYSVQFYERNPRSGNHIWRWTQDAEREWKRGFVECGMRPNYGVVITQITEPPPLHCRMRLEQIMAGQSRC